MNKKLLLATLIAAAAHGQTLDYTGPVMTGTITTVDQSDGDTLSTQNVTMQFTAALTAVNGSVTAFSIDGAPVQIVSVGNTSYFDLIADGPGGVLTLATNAQGQAIGASVVDQVTYQGGMVNYAFGAGNDMYFSETEQAGGTQIAYESLTSTSGGNWSDPTSAPELDLSRAGIALTLFAGLALVLRGRRA